MDRYYSPGVATIAALIGPDHDRPDHERADRRPDAGLGVEALMRADGQAPATRGYGEASPVTVDFAHIGRRCERGVVTAYRELLSHGAEDLDALHACTALYRIHHPDETPGDARVLVAGWIDHHVIRGAAGPTPGCDCG